MLPDIKVSLPIIFLAWCAAAWFAFDGPVMLSYPAMWLVVGLAFWGLDRAYRGSRPSSSAVTNKSGKRVDQERERTAEPTSSFDAA